MTWRVWFKPKYEAFTELGDMETAQVRYSEVIEAEYAFVDRYAKTLSFLPKSEPVEAPPEGTPKRRGARKKALVHALRVINADVWKEFEQEP